MIFIDFDFLAPLPFYDQAFFWLKQNPSILISITMDRHQGSEYNCWKKNCEKKKKIEKDILLVVLKNLFFFCSKQYSMARSPRHIIKGCFSCSWTFYGGNVMWYTLKVRNYQIFKDICYRLHAFLYYTSRQ